MPIPNFDKRGLLPAGVHVCSMGEFRVWAGSIPDSAHRLALVTKFENFLNQVVGPIASGWPLVIDGSFVTDKAQPNDIDFALDLRNCNNDLIEMNAFRAIVLGHNRNKAVYSVDGYVIFRESNDFQDFFGYVGQKTGAVKNLGIKDRKGTLRVEQW